MAVADSKKWRVRVSNNLPALDSEIADVDSAKNQGYISKIQMYSAPDGAPGHTTRCFWGDTVPNATDYNDAVAPIGSMFYRLIVTAGVITGAECYIKSAASTWVLFTPPGEIAAAKTAAYNVLSSEKLVLADTSGGAFIVTLPLAAASIGQAVIFKNVGTGINALTIDGNGAELIDGAASVATMDAQFDTITVMSDGVGWHIIASVLA